MNTRTPTTAADATPYAGHGPSTNVRQLSPTISREAYADLTTNFNKLVGNYDALHGQTMQIALLGAEIGGARDVKESLVQFRQQMREQDLRHKEAMQEIQNIIDQILENEGDEMRRQVNQEIATQIDEIVKEQVAQCLKDHIPEDLQLELARNRQEFEELQLALHNSESRRLNGTLRASKPEEMLHTIYMPNGSVSPQFPKDLKGLFSLDADTVKSLVTDYGLAGVSDARDANLNRFMQFCGVRYQLVVKPNNHKTNTTRTE